jgi:hypothetical protein
MGAAECNQEGLRLESEFVALQKKSQREALAFAWKASYYFLLGDSCEKARQMLGHVLAAPALLSEPQKQALGMLAGLDGRSLRQFRSFMLGKRDSILDAKRHEAKGDTSIFLTGIGFDESASNVVLGYVLPYAHDFLKAIDLANDKRHRCSLCGQDK